MTVTKKKNLQLLENAGLLPHEHCTPYLAHLKGNKNSKADLQLSRAEALNVRLPDNEKPPRVTKEAGREQVQSITKQAAEHIQAQRKPFEDAMAETKKKLNLLDHYSSVFSDNAVIPLKDFPRGSYSVMAMRETQTQFGQKFILLIETNDTAKGPFALCYSNKYIETYVHENLSAAEKEKIRDPYRNYLTLYNKPLATLNITGWGRTPQRHVVVYCNLIFTEHMEKYSLKTIRYSLTKEMTEQRVQMESALAAATNSATPLPQLAREEMVPYKHCKNLAELPLGSIYTVVAIGYSEHYGQQKLVVKLDDGSLYQAGPHVEENKEQLADGWRLVIHKVRLNISTRRKFAVCKIVQRGDWAGVVDYDKVSLLPTRKVGGSLTWPKVLDVKSVETRGKKRKLILVEDGTVYKVRRSMENRL